jgi:hypothetical protein
VTPATARARGRAHARSKVVPRGPRRISGPVVRNRPAPAGGAALPRRGTTSVFGRIRALPEHRVVDSLLRSRLWIWVLGASLGGIVAMQVSLLKLNSGISRAVETTTTLERQNADLEASIARLSAPDRIETGATALGMLMPPAGDVGYLTAGSHDPANAVRRMRDPSDDAAALMANHGIVPGSLADVAPVTQPAATTEPAAAATPAPTAAATPVPTATPAPVSTPPPAASEPTTTSQTTGGVVAGQG